VATGDLTTALNVKAQAPVLGSAADTLIGTLITQASAFIATFTDRSFTGAVARTEIRNGPGGTELFLAEGPVTAITFTSSSDTGLAIDNRPIPAQPADGQPGYFLVDNGLLCLSGYVFTRGKRNVRVKYQAGYASIPKDIEQACIELVVAAYKRVPRDPGVETLTEPKSGVVHRFSVNDLPAYAQRVIDQYRKVVPL
jgi:hypothetical protein